MANEAPTAAPPTAPAEATQAPTNDNAAASPPANDSGQQSAEGKATLADAAREGVLSHDELRALTAGKKIPLVIYGKERLVDADQAIRYLQKGEAGNEALETTKAERKALEAEKAKIQKRDANIMAAFDADPVEALERMGYGDKLWAALEKRAQLGAMTPEQREQHEHKTERERFAAEKKAFEDAKRREHEERQKAQHQQQAAKDADALTASWTKALDGAQFPANPKRREAAIRHMHAQAMRFIDAGEPLPDPRWLADDAKADYEERRREAAEALEPDELESVLGPEKVRKFEQARIAKLRDTQQPRVAGKFAPKAEPKQSAKEAPRKYYGNTFDAWKAAKQAAKGKQP
jgi:hypothetical protein